MVSNNPQEERLVFTAALKEELPIDFIKECGSPVITPRGLESGISSCLAKRYQRDSVVFVVTGVGREWSEKSARLILKYLNPLAVVNVGGCGINTEKDTSYFNHVLVASHTKTKGTLLRCLTEPPFPLSPEINLKKAAVESLEKPLLRHDPNILPLVDMEAGFQHRIFRKHTIPFSAIKIPADRCSASSRQQFKKALIRIHRSIKRLLSFLDPSSFPDDVSVVIPVHNRPGLIKRAVSSVINQSHRPREIIVVDDGSDQPVEEVLGRETDIKKRVNIIRFSKNRGVGAARNAGIRTASSTWIALLDSDDEWKRKKLENQFRFLKKRPFFEIEQCEEIWIRRGKRVNRCKHHEKEAGWIWQKSIEMCAISPSGVLLRKGLLERFGCFREEFPACEDFEMWLRISGRKPVGLNPEPDLIKYGGHPDQLSTRFEAMDRFRVAALLIALEAEEEPEKRDILRTAIIKRLSILYNGARKRKNLEGVKTFKELLENLQNGKEVSWKDHPLLLKKRL